MVIETMFGLGKMLVATVNVRGLDPHADPHFSSRRKPLFQRPIVPAEDGGSIENPRVFEQKT